MVELTTVLAGVTKWGDVERRGSGGVGKMRWILAGVYAKRMSGFEEKLICSFKFAVNILKTCVCKFMNDKDGPTFLKINIISQSSRLH